jgi:nucleotide-binding universal stress UspA family protein
MNETILLAVDAVGGDPAKHVTAAADLTRKLARDTGDRVIVLHIHEYATGRWGRMQVDCGEGAGERVVDRVVSGLRDAGITVEGVIGSALFGHVARAILAAADDYDARIIVLGSSSRTDLPHLAFGSVSHRLLHLARRPVLIVPRPAVPAQAPPVPDAPAAAATTLKEPVM